MRCLPRRLRPAHKRSSRWRMHMAGAWGAWSIPSAIIGRSATRLRSRLTTETHSGRTYFGVRRSEDKETRNMRTLVVGTFVTLDGVMQAPGGPNEDRDGGFQHGGWLVPYFDEKFGEIMTEWTKRADAFLLGRKTYEMFVDSWPKSADPAEALNIRPKFVASRTLDTLTWNNSILLKGDVV